MSAPGLPRRWRVQIHNDTGETIDCTVSYRGQKLTSAGVLEYAGTVATIIDDDDIADGAVGQSDTVLNTGNKFLGAAIYWSIAGPITGSPSLDGLVTVRMQIDSTDDSDSYQDDEDGIILASVYFYATSANETRSGCVLI